MMAVNWRKPVSVPLWLWELYWFFGLLSGNVFSILISALLMAMPFFPERYNHDDYDDYDDDYDDN